MSDRTPDINPVYNRNCPLCKGNAEWIIELRKENAKLREALAFYADDGNYANTGYEQYRNIPCPVEADQGKRARIAMGSE